MKDKCGGLAIDEVVAVRSKMYSVKKADKKYKEGEGGEKKCDRKGDNTRALQRSAH